jgi:hypothetical protein
MWYTEFYLPTKAINHKGDAMDRIVTEIASPENQINQFFVNQKRGGSFSPLKSKLLANEGKFYVNSR